MSVIVTGECRHIPIIGQNSILPFYGSIHVVGDGTGGIATTVLTLNPDTAIGSRCWYKLTSINLSSSDPASGDAKLILQTRCVPDASETQVEIDRYVDMISIAGSNYPTGGFNLVSFTQPIFQAKDPSFRPNVQAIHNTNVNGANYYLHVCGLFISEDYLAKIIPAIIF